MEQDLKDIIALAIQNYTFYDICNARKRFEEMKTENPKDRHIEVLIYDHDKQYELTFAELLNLKYAT